ncbi:MAG: anthranilate synthase component II [Puniceicoccaceae bacterium]
MLLLLDNYDSFTYNLVQYFGELGVMPEVYRNDRITVGEAVAKNPSALVISPGPCSPNEAGGSLAMIAEFAGRIPVFGVCLGHQCIGQHFGGRVVRAERLMHGKTSPIHHRGESVFAGIPDPFDATRYHSLIVERASLPACLRVTAWTAEGEIMGLRHESMEIHGVQFHPESLATGEGRKILANFLALSGLLPASVAAPGKSH